MFTRIRSVMIAVNNLDESAKLYADSFGVQAGKPVDNQAGGVKEAAGPVGDCQIEFLEPLDPQEGAVAKFLQKRGEGVYMIAVEVENLDAAVKSLTEKGVRLLNADPESRAKGAHVYIHPKSTKGVLIQLDQKP